MITWNDMEDIYRSVFGPVGLAGTSSSDNSTWFTYDYAVKPASNQINKVNMPAVKSVIFNKNATIVYFDDGTKCIVRKSAMDEYNREHAVVYAIVKRAYGIVNADGTVDGNGMGNMLAKVVANGYDQEAHDEAENAKKASKQKPKFVGDDDHAKYCWCEKIVRPWKYEKSTNRDSKGRFVKKTNRK